MAGLTSDDIDAKLVQSILQFNQLYRFNKTHVHNLGKPYDERQQNIKYSEFLLLFYIRSAVRDKQGGVSATELSARMNVKPPTINPLLNNLDKLGFITRKTDLNDRRFIRIELSPDGIRLTQEHEDKFVKKIHGLAEYLGYEKSTNLIDLMNDVYTYLKSQCK